MQTDQQPAAGGNAPALPAAHRYAARLADVMAFRRHIELAPSGWTGNGPSLALADPVGVG